MFIGHFGLSLGAKKIAPQVSLGTMFIATQFVDILWPFFLISDVEHVAITPGYTKMNAFEFLHYPYTHSLLMGIVWGFIAGLIYWLIKKDSRGSIVIGLGVLSHWFLDLVVHVADLPWTPFGEAKVGFGLWNHVAITLLLEGIIFFTGLYFYISVTKAKNRIGSWGLWSLVTLLILFTISGLVTPPPSGSLMSMFVSFNILMILIVGLAYWVDANRERA
ncbi:MAG TPA: metal-dependent hydrolase [Cyclobacteriaceae bacterium]